MISLTLSSAPPSLNSSNAIISVFSEKQGKMVPRRIKTKSFKAWIKEAGQEVMIQRQKPIDGPVVVEIEIRRQPDQARADVDNKIKHVVDLLVTHRLISDDSKVNRVTATWLDNQDAPACRVEVRKA